jgi:TFIIF-interacting CTD phosphatase-like protein
MWIQLASSNGKHKSDLRKTSRAREVEEAEAGARRGAVEESEEVHPASCDVDSSSRGRGRSGRAQSARLPRLSASTAARRV